MHFSIPETTELRDSRGSAYAVSFHQSTDLTGVQSDLGQVEISS